MFTGLIENTMLHSSTINSAADGLQLLGIRYFAIGSLDIGSSSVDPNTGLKRVSVAIKGEVIDVNSAHRETIASALENASGEGSNLDIAKNNALLLAAKNVALRLTEQLQIRNIKN